MENNSRFKEWANKASDWLNEQVWFQQLRTKWDELDPNSRSYLKAGGVAGVLLLFVGIVFGTYWSVLSTQREYNQKVDLLSMIQSANEEIRTLREQTAGISSAPAGATTGAWSSYFENVASGAGIEKDKLAIGNEKPGASGDTTKESLYEVSLRHVSIKQVVRYAVGLETGSRPVKLRNLQIDTQGDPEGYMNATLSLSGFAMVAK